MDLPRSPRRCWPRPVLRHHLGLRAKRADRVKLSALGQMPPLPPGVITTQRNGSISTARRTPITISLADLLRTRGAAATALHVIRTGAKPASCSLSWLSINPAHAPPPRGERLARRNLPRACHLRCCAPWSCRLRYKPQPFFPTPVPGAASDAITSRHRAKSIAVLGAASRAISGDHLET
jgi:hypothetical protein